MDFSWGSILTLAATTGVFTALLNQVLGLLRELWASSKKRKANARYSALRLAVLLESYVDECAKRVAEVEEYISSRGLGGDDHAALPVVPPYPVGDDSWQAMSLNLLDRCLSLPNKVAASQQMIHSVATYGDEHEAREQYVEEGVARGLEAWNLAADLRSQYGFGPHSAVYNYAAYLERVGEHYRERRQKKNEQGAKDLEGLLSSEPSNPVAHGLARRA